jgi:Holliday junction resolvase RusA-like endonuclease
MRGGYASAYTPKETVSYENLVKYTYQAEVGKTFDKDIPLRVLIVALYEIPQSTSKKRANLMRTGEIRPTKKPDTDNIAKIICDSLNGIAYHDDAQVVDLKVVKYYSDTPCVTVTIEEVTGDDSEGNGS